MYLFRLTFLAFIALSSSAKLPSTSYLPQIQGSSSQNSFSQNQFFSVSGSSSGDTGNRRPQQEIEKNADILKQDTEVGESGFHYSFETSNGIRAEESNNNGQSQGGFSYKGDDGNIYSIAFTAGEGGYRPQGAHLPVAPPTPEAILLALQQNARDEAAGIFDDGFHYSFETSNGIRAEESNNNGQSQGGFSYKGDDGNIYSIAFTAGEGGYRPQGAHLPVAPPTPEAILLALQQNARDEAAGIFDDGKYKPAVHEGGKAGSGSGGSSSGLNAYQSSSSSSSSSSFGSGSHQASFNPNSGYRY